MNAQPASPVVNALRALVRDRHNGSGSRAAAFWSLPRSTAFSWLAERPHAPRKAHIEAIAQRERIDAGALTRGLVVPTEQGSTAPADALARIAALAGHPVARRLAAEMLSASDVRERRGLFACREAFLSGARPRSWRADALDATATGSGAFAMRDGRAIGVEGIIIEPTASGGAVARRVTLDYASAQRIERELAPFVSRIEGEADL